MYPSSLLLLAPILLYVAPTLEGANEDRRSLNSLASLEGLGLFPFPRTGRSGSSGALPVEKYLQFIRHNPDQKTPKTKKGLELDGDPERRLVGSLWFGPRLGKKSLKEGPRNISYRPRALINDGWKRQISGLIPFGRTGRSQPSDKRLPNGASASGGLWFGPRLGKRAGQLSQPIYFQELQLPPELLAEVNTELGPAGPDTIDPEIK